MNNIILNGACTW